MAVGKEKGKGVNFMRDDLINFLTNSKWVLPIIKMLLILVIGHFAIVFLLKAMKKALSKSDIDRSIIRFSVKTANIILHILILLSALNTIGVSTNGILATFSAAAIAVSLALKDSLSNVAGGILLLISPCFSTGDYISANGEAGTVLSIDLLHTRIQTVDGKIVNMPNGVLINQSIVNFTGNGLRRVDIIFPIPYEIDVEVAKNAAMEVLKSNEMVLTEPEAPFARVKDYGDSAVNILVRAWCEGKNYWALYFDLTEQVREKFGQNGIDIPFNQLDVHIKNE